MCASFLLGIDAGTTVIKSTLFALDGREVAGAAHDSSLLTPRPGWAEADMNAVWRAVVATVQQTLRQGGIAPRDVLAVGVTGQGDGTWLVDVDSRPVRPAILWSDGRTAALVQASHRSGLSAEVFQITGTALNTCNQGLHLRWLQENEPDAVARTAAVLRAKDWIFLNLTGVVSTDETDASHTFFSIHDRRYDERIFSLLGIERWRSKIPPAPPPSHHRAGLLPDIAAKLGLHPGTPVTAGPFDVAASALGAGAIDAGDACSVMGTAGVHQIVTERPVLEPANLGYNMCYVPADRLMRLLPTMTNTPNLQWFVREFCAAESAAAAAGGTDVWDELERLVADVPVGSYGVMYHPYIDPAGERAPFVCSSARAQFTGLSIQHGRQVVLRAVYEGVALSVLDCYRTMGVPVAELRLAGGGARSPLWAQILSDALSCPVIVAEGQEYGAKGAVINAGVAVGVYASYADGVARTVRAAHRYAPDAVRADDYAILLQVYRSVRDAMLPVWEQRAQLLQRFTESMQSQ
jgi:erythritol kinase (D-erythritol 1-phosphate-forming)